MTFVTGYLFGISQTDSDPAIEGAIDYAYMFRPEIGVCAGLFGSNVDFDDGDEADVACRTPPGPVAGAMACTPLAEWMAKRKVVEIEAAVGIAPGPI